MRNLKIASGFAVCGFILSFVFGLFSHSNFIHIVFKAFVFAIVFALLGYAVAFIYSKFLDDESGSEFTPESSGEEGNESTVKKGSVVDLTIEDEDLETSDDENTFNVGVAHQMLNSSDIQSSKDNSVAEKKDDVYENPSDAILRGESVTNPEPAFSDIKEKPVTSSTKKASDNKAADNSAGSNVDSEEDIDTLPDMNAFAFDNNETQSDEDSSEDSFDDANSGFGSTITSTRPKSSEKTGEVQDASLMAKAISSILSNEES